MPTGAQPTFVRIKSPWSNGSMPRRVTIFANERRQREGRLPPDSDNILLALESDAPNGYPRSSRGESVLVTSNPQGVVASHEVHPFRGGRAELTLQASEEVRSGWHGTLIVSLTNSRREECQDRIAFVVEAAPSEDLATEKHGRMLTGLARAVGLGARTVAEARKRGHHTVARIAFRKFVARAASRAYALSIHDGIPRAAQYGASLRSLGKGGLDEKAGAIVDLLSERRLQEVDECEPHDHTCRSLISIFGPEEDVAAIVLHFAAARLGCNEDGPAAPERSSGAATYDIWSHDRAPFFANSLGEFHDRPTPHPYRDLLEVSLAWRDLTILVSWFDKDEGAPASGRMIIHDGLAYRGEDPRGAMPQHLRRDAWFPRWAPAECMQWHECVMDFHDAWLDTLLKRERQRAESERREGGGWSSCKKRVTR